MNQVIKLVVVNASRGVIEIHDLVLEPVADFARRTHGFCVGHKTDGARNVALRDAGIRGARS